MNVNIVAHGDVLLAVSDMTGEVVVDKDTLEATGQWEWDDSIKSLFAMITTAHPSRLPNSPDTISYHAKGIR